MITITKLRIVFLAVFLMCTQWYFTMLSTQHALHNMTLKCPVCATVNSYDSTAVTEVHVASVSVFLIPVLDLVDKIYSRSFVHVYLSRAPPRI